MKKLLSLTNTLFVLTMLSQLLPDVRAEEKSVYFTAIIVIIHFLYLLSLFLIKNDKQKRTIGDVLSIIYSTLFTWEISTAKSNLLDTMLFPTPDTIISLFITDLPELIKGLGSSMQLLVTGYFLALAAAIPLALVIGWRERLYRAVTPLTKVLGPIPTIVYIPYAIVLLPTFKTASIFIIFVGAFWPVFINTLNGVFSIEKKIIDSAKVLNVSEGTMLFRIILPGAMPSIISGATIGLVLSFILLTAAEMIGASSGLGWYVKYFSDFADYPRVIVGIIFIGIVVSAVTVFFDKVERYLLRWRN